MKIKVIKNEQEYKKALKYVELLMNQDPDPDSEDGEKLSLLVTLIKDYESNMFPDSFPDPIDAILFRMEQQNLKPRDLVSYIGSRSKVSEVLSRKRSLTISMIRALQNGLGIPAKVLLKEPDVFRDTTDIAWKGFPLKEMEKRGYFGDKLLKDSKISELMESFFRPVGSPSQFIGSLRKSYYVRSVRPMYKQALTVWSGYVVKKANKIKYPNVFKKGTVNLAFMQEVVKLSTNPKGPALVQDFLKNHGIALVIEHHFPQTYLDGATIMTNKHPIIGLTIRHDRLDNFWFTLMHELAHIALHYGQPTSLFYDNLDELDPNSTEERDADHLAGEALIPESKWENSPARLVPSPIAAQSLAQELGIHISIVAGKMRHNNERYRFLNQLVGQGEVRKLFPEIRWKNKYV